MLTRVMLPTSDGFYRVANHGGGFSASLFRGRDSSTGKKVGLAIADLSHLDGQALPDSYEELPLDRSMLFVNLPGHEKRFAPRISFPLGVALHAGPFRAGPGGTESRLSTRLGTPRNVAFRFAALGPNDAQDYMISFDGGGLCTLWGLEELDFPTDHHRRNQAIREVLNGDPTALPGAQLLVNFNAGIERFSGTDQDRVFEAALLALTS